MAVCGMFVTIFGVVIVSLEGTGKNKTTKKQRTYTCNNGNTAGMEKVEDEDEDSDGASDHGESCNIELTIQGQGMSSSEQHPVDFNNGNDQDNDTIETQTKSNPSVASYFASDLSRGYLLAVLNVGLDCMGSILTKMHGDDFNTWEINLIRFGSASVVMGLFASCGKLFYNCNRDRNGNFNRNCNTRSVGNDDKNDDGRMTLVMSGTMVDREEKEDRVGGVVVGAESSRQDRVEDRDTDSAKHEIENTDDFWFNMPFSTMTRQCWMQVTTGVMFVTFLCPVLSIYALFTMDVALCLTLTSLGPLYSLPLVYVMKGEKVTLWGIGGTVVACIGVVMLTAL